MQYLKIILILFLLVENSLCLFENLKPIMRDRLQDLKERAHRVFGSNVIINKPMKEWEFELQDRLVYPRGDKNKLSEIANEWHDYYKCSVDTLDKLTKTGSLPSTSVVVYSGAIARIPCGVCIAPDEIVTWIYAKSLNNLTFVPMEESLRAVTTNGSLTIHNVAQKDSGVYRCQIGRSGGGIMLLEVLDYEHNYTVVKPARSHGPYAESPVKVEGLVVFTNWSPWSGCSRCGRWGRRRKYGLCHVRLAGVKDSIGDKDVRYLKELNRTCTEGLKILREFREGMWCKSTALPNCIRDLEVVRLRNNEILLGMCKKPCKQNVIFSVVTQNGVVLEQANNTAGIYSLSQWIQSPPPPVSEVVFAARGSPRILRCPGTCLKDVPTTWRAGNAHISELAISRNSGGRVRINARDHLVFNAVYYSDANLYSCWQEDNLCGEVKLEIWQGGVSDGNRTILLLAIILAFYTLRLVDRIYRARRRRIRN